MAVGLRHEGGFVGRHDALGLPEPEHISAAHQDSPDLLEGLVLFEQHAKALDYDPVLTMASIAFGFVYIHPFEDGNGRIHRFLMHHVLADRNYRPEEIVFPISSVILHDIARHKDVLERTSGPLLPFIAWEPTKKCNVRIINDTSDYCRYFDAAAHAELMLRCIERAVDVVLPGELACLQYRDEVHRRVTDIVDRGARTIDTLLGFLRQNGGRLGRRARDKEFKALAEHESAAIEAIYAELSA